MKLETLCGQLAVTTALKGQNLLARQEVVDCVKASAMHLSSIADQVLLALVSDNMLLRDADSGNDFHFRHSRVIEYLVGYHIVNTVSESADFAGIDKLTSQLIDGGLVSMYQVHECIKWICKKDFPALSNTIDSFYANSKPFMAATLLRLRQSIASGDKTSKEDIALVLGRTDVADARIVWDSFFVIAAMGNKQTKIRVLDAFDVAWTSNQSNAERWKLLKKLSQHELLLEESVFLWLTESQRVKEWEVYLGCIVENASQSGFADLWKASGIDIEDCGCMADSAEWKYVKHLLDCLLNGVSYIPGDKID